MKILILGDKPSSKNLDPNIPFEGTQSGKRLSRWIKIISDQVVDTTFYIKNTHNEDFLKDISQYDIVIALGNNASKRVKDLKHYKLPHPSNRNRIWNQGSEKELEILMRLIDNIKKQN